MGGRLLKAIKAYRELEPEDFKVLRAVELESRFYKYVPIERIVARSGLAPEEVSYRLSKLNRLELLVRRLGSYTGFALNPHGYDCLAIRSLVLRGVISAISNRRINVGKEADIYEAITPGGQRVSVKFNRLGRVSFKHTKRYRDYSGEKPRISWFLESVRAAKKEYNALRILSFEGVSVPKPIARDRHVVVMEFIEGVDLYNCHELPDPRGTLEEILKNVKKAYSIGVVHGDLSEYNVIVKPGFSICIIDWPQYVSVTHPMADFYLRRDLENLLRFFRKRFGVSYSLERALSYVKSLENPPPSPGQNEKEH